MKVLYLISSLGHGQGGHLYSLRDLVKSLDRHRMEPVIAVMGDGVPTRVLDNLACRKYFFLMRRADEMSSVLDRLVEVARAERPDVIHSCSNTALFCAMHLSRIFRLPFLHTQPHGLKPDHFPRIPALIAYSEEGASYFADDPRYRDMEIICAPNRVAAIVPDRERSERLKRELNFPHGLVFLRIARICEMYRESFLKSITLVQKLNEEGIAANLLIVGVNEQPWICEELRRHENERMRLVTDDAFTHDADDLMDIADVVIGAGSSFMAAASLGKLLLTTPSFARLPVLVDEGNFDRLLSINFRSTSPRLAGPSHDEHERYAALKKVLGSASARDAYRKFSLDCFRRHFDVRSFMPRYERICERLAYRPLAGVREHYARLLDTLCATSERVADGIGVERLKRIAVAILVKMFVARICEFAGLTLGGGAGEIVARAAGQGLEVRDFRVARRTYDLVVLAQAHNEEKLIGRFLAEAAGVADGIVLLDDGSADRTNEFAEHEKLLLKVRRPQHGGFNDLANRNLLLSFAEHIPARWFLFLDIDEVVDERYRKVLGRITTESDADVVEVGIVNLWGDEHHFRFDSPPPAVNGVLWRPRLFRKKAGMKIHSSQRLHFKLVPYPAQGVARRGIMVRHYGSMTAERRKMRYERYHREDPDHRFQKSYEHIIAEKVAVKPIECAYEEVDRVAAGTMKAERS